MEGYDHDSAAVEFVMSSASKVRQFIPVRFALLTVSDSRGLDQDESGKQLADRINRAGHTVVERKIMPDERHAIASQLRDWAGNEIVDAVITSGGTGLTGRDVTVEAHRDIYEKEIDAFASVFAAVSVETIGPSAIQSRACGGVALGTYFFALPGSPGACRDAWDRILGPQFDYRTQPCNLVEIMPRLDEHLRRK